MRRYLRCETNVRQVPRKGAGVISPLGVGTLLGSDTRCCLRCEDNTRHVPRRGAGVIGSLWSDSRRGAASCLATVAPSPPPPARRVAGQTRVFLFHHGGKSSSSLPPPGEPTTVVVVVLRAEEYHVVAVVGGHELETPEAEHRPGLKVAEDCPSGTQWESICQHAAGPLPGAPTVSVLDLQGPSTDQ
jgi:hypothetical protein